MGGKPTLSSEANTGGIVCCGTGTMLNGLKASNDAPTTFEENLMGRIALPGIVVVILIVIAVLYFLR
jgi:hypothetical protein